MRNNYSAGLQVKFGKEVEMCQPVPVLKSPEHPAEEPPVPSVEFRPAKTEQDLINPFDLPEPVGPLGNGGC